MCRACSVDWGGESPPASLMEAKASEAQGRCREAGSEGSVEQRCEPTDRNWISKRLRPDESVSDDEVHIHQGPWT